MKHCKSLHYLWILWIGTTTYYPSWSQQEVREIIHLAPIQLKPENLGRQILCHRPARRGGPRMAIEEIGNKIIAHNYGHSGSGWTLAPGAAQYVVSLLENYPQASQLTRETPITIIGAGALGLLAAYELVQRGYRTVTLVAKERFNLTSHNAGGAFANISYAPGTGGNPVIDTITANSYLFYKKIAEQKNPYIVVGARQVTSYFDSRAHSGLESLVAQQLIAPARDVLLDFGNGTQRPMVAYAEGLFLDVDTLIYQLHRYLSSHIQIVQTHIQDFGQLTDNFIINCSGMGAKELCNDDNVFSVQGHLILLKQQDPVLENYILSVQLEDGILASGHKIHHSFYIIPKRIPNSGPHEVGVMGGTYIEDATAATPHQEVFADVVEHAQQFYGLT